MTKRELFAARFVAAVVAGKGDRRKMSNVLHDAFTSQEREELTQIARKAMGE